MTAHVNDPIRVGNRWVFANGRTLPVVSGGDETADAGTDDGDEVVVERSVEMPEDLTDREAIDDDALGALEAALVAEMDAAFDAGSSDVALFKAIADDIEAVRGEVAIREEVDQQNADDIAAQIARVRGTQASDAPDDGEADDGDGDDEEGDDGDDTDAKTDDAEKVDEAKEPVTASARPARRSPRGPKPSAMRQHASPVDAGAGHAEAMTISLTAAAEVPGFSTGAKMSTRDIAVGMHAKARGLVDGGSRVPVATVTRNYPSVLTQDAESMTLDDLLGTKAVDAMVAAGGWCVPHQTLYDIFAIEGTGSLFDLPTINITRGGIEVPDFFGYDAANSGLWTWTATNDENATNGVALSNLAITSNVVTVDTATDHGLAVGDSVRIATSTAAFAVLDGKTLTVATVTDANTFTAAFTNANIASAAAVGTVTPIKGCFRITCPTWTDYELEAEGLCVTHGNLMDRAYPELTTRYVNLVMAAHERRVARQALGKVLAAAHTTGVTYTTGTSDAAGELLSAIDLQAQDYRSQYGMDEGAVLEVVLPLWTFGAIRATLAKRQGVDLFDVTNDRIRGWFADRGVRAQFVRDYQELYATTPKTAWPTSIKFAMYPAGGFFKGDGGSIDLGVQRDSRLNETNDHTVAWTEQFYLIGRRGPKAREVTVTIDTDGVTACCP
jgi:hypothetical protein